MLFTPALDGNADRLPLPERFQEVFPLFGQGVDAPPALPLGRNKPALPEAAEVIVDGRERYAESLCERVPVDLALANLPQDALLRRADDSHFKPRWDSDTADKWLIT
jgi:hypothetical protein